MAMLASKPSFPTAMGGAAYQNTSPAYRNNNNAVYGSPTESEFSDSSRMSDTVKNWDEQRVGEWLISINCGQYVDIFKSNNITGENLMDMDPATLKEMGVTKIGDRVRIGSQAKLFRTTVYRKTSKRNMNRLSLATLDGNAQANAPPASSPRERAVLSTTRIQPPPTSLRDKRMSRRIDGQDLAKANSRPSSPLIDQENRSRVPMQKSNSTPYLPKPSQRLTPGETPPRFGGPVAGHIRSSPSVDNLATHSSALPADKALIRVIFDSGRSSMINIEGCETADDIVLKTLKKGALNENHVKNFCFYLLDGLNPDPKYCRRLGDTELLRICNDRVRGERGRLMLRKIHAGEPEGEQLRIAAKIAGKEAPSPPAIEVQQPINKSKSHLKIEQLIGEPLAAVSYPMSPASLLERERNSYFAAQPAINTAGARARKLKEFYGARPPTELITQDLTSYFPDIEKEEMDKTVRMSIRRSRRLSRAANRLSTMSSFSVASSLKDAPPLPTIADSWLNSANHPKPLRPLSVVRLGRPVSNYRDSITSSVLEPLDEESPLEPNRKSYVSFGADSGSDSVAVTDPEGNTIMQSYFDDTGSTSPANTENGGSLNSRLSQVIAEDSEESDDELMEHLENDSWENLKYMKGAMIGQGSFGTVYLALHAITGELMACKQVEMPSSSGTHLDAKKNNMVEALKREIGLLRELKHPNIVQYLGSNSDDSHLNIFLEYVAGGSVATMLVNYGSLGEPLIANFVRQILSGLAYLHSKDIIHRDIKGANILVDNHGSVKISDFGISKRVEASSLLVPPTGKRAGPRVSLQGSVFWMAPEVVKQTAYTRKADIWSLGCLIVEMFTGVHPHPNCTQLQAIFKIGSSAAQARPDMPEQASESAKFFLERTFEIEHEKRPSADELLGYAFCAPKEPGSA
ncbi:Pkinase-domain-containing protein [Aureobasidium sp. EXF-10728]|nr:Pkinase-domain-containing protein [Aureobasidium sp. EXF-10728]